MSIVWMDLLASEVHLTTLPTRPAHALHTRTQPYPSPYTPHCTSPYTPPYAAAPTRPLHLPGQVVALIEASGLVLGVSTNLLGLTLVAWGNSAGMGVGTCRACAVCIVCRARGVWCIWCILE